MSYKLPKGWIISLLSEQVDKLIGGGTPSKNNPEYWNGNIPWASVKDITGSCLSSTQDYITELGLKNSSSNLIPANTVIIATRMAVGRVARFLVDVAINQDLRAIFPKSGLDTDFLFYWMQSKEPSLQSVATGTTVKGIRQEIIKNLAMALPPLPEQRRIAEILTSVDEAIAATQAVIDQTRKVKQGVLQQLLTKGIGHNRFKHTKIGEIPESWDVTKLVDLLAPVPTPMRSGPFGSALKKAELVSSGIPFLGIDNIHIEHFVNKYRRFVSPQKASELARFLVREGDVIITIMGTVGRSCVVPAGIGSALSSKHLWSMSFDPKKCLPSLICWQLNYAPWVLKEFARASQGGIMGAINSKVLKELLLPIPKIVEQQEIDKILSSFNADIYQKEIELNRLKMIKNALMSDLLTGRKRVFAHDQIAAQ
jgi:type I restriction enzyme S subunit